MHIWTFNHGFIFMILAHKGAVRGVAVDALNQMTVTGGADCCVKFWKFKTKQLLETVTLETQVAFIRLHRDR